MTPTDLRTWQAHQGYTYTSAALALGMGRSNYALMLSGQTKIDRRTALACAALAAGLPPWGASEALGEGAATLVPAPA